MQAVEEVCAEQAQGFILTFGDDLRALADHDHEEGDQRRSDEKDNAREQVNRENEDQNGKGQVR